jgi:hypothetical protein
MGKSKPEIPIEIALIMRPNYLKVNKAIILFKSNSKFRTPEIISRITHGSLSVSDS